MPRHYRSRSPWERDATQEAAQATRRHNMAGRDTSGRDDMREPFPLLIGEWVRWEVRPDRRNVRQWVPFDDGEPVRNEEGRVIRAGIDRLMQEAARRVPVRNMLGRRRWQ